MVITGAGIVTALGLGWRPNAAALRTGRTAFRPVTLFDVSRQRTKIAAEADLPPTLPPVRLSPHRQRRLDRATRMLLLAAREAWQQAGLQDGTRLPLVLGTTSGGMTHGEAYLTQALGCPASLRRQATRMLNYQVQRHALDVSEALGFEGSLTVISNACASGANAIGHASELLRHGHAACALAGGYDALCQLTFAGFDSLQVLAPAPCRPFAADRNGLSLGEGAGILVLETLDHARERGAEILGEILAYAAATDTHHLTQPHPEGLTTWATMTAACRDAGLTPDVIDYLNAHGTGTPQNDRTEAAAINRWAGPRAATLPVSSTKACMGHLLGAAGAVEALVTLMTLREQWLPPQPGLLETDGACRFPVVREPTAARVTAALTNSIGFGGANATLILGKGP